MIRRARRHSVTDLALLAGQADLDTGAGLPGTPHAPLDQPSPRYPEVTFCSP